MKEVVDYKELANGSEPSNNSSEPSNNSSKPSEQQSPGLASGKGKLTDDIAKANYSIGELAKLDPSVRSEIELATKRAHFLFNVGNTVEKMEYQRLCLEEVASRIEAENAKFQAAIETSIAPYIDAHKKAGERFSKALEQQHKIAGQLPPYSSMV